MEDERRDGWSKADIILKPVGGLLTALAVAGLGFFGARVLDRRQAEDNRVRLYTELMSQREASETAFRKEMFHSILGTFLAPTSTGLEQEILNLELLAYNFNEEFDLHPLFARLHAKVKGAEDVENRLRLEEAADEVKSRQIGSLTVSGATLEEIGRASCRERV